MRRHLSTKTAWWVAVTGWLATLLLLGVWSAASSPATVREQRDIVAAKEVIDTVVGQVSGQLPAGWNFFDDGYQDEACRVTVVRDGIAATRTLSLSGPAGTESDAVSRVASGLDGATLRPGSGPPDGFFFDAGEFVSVRARVAGPGSVVIVLKTGCRPVSR